MPELTTPPMAIPMPEAKQVKLEKFRGIDLTSGVVNVHTSRSPDAPNMMPDDDGFPKKRPGWEVAEQFTGAIHGIWWLETGQAQKQVVHAGSGLYVDGALLHDAMADADSAAVQVDGKLWIVDGQTYVYCDGEKCEAVSAIATVPLITIAKAPNGQFGATSYRPINLLTGWRTDSYAGTADDKVYVLSFGALSAAAVKVEKLDASGVWVAAASGYTVDRTAGKVTFTAAPGVSPVTGEDNVRISYEVAQSEAGRVDKMRHIILFGVNGALDRVFLAGNPEEPNVDYWSEWGDPAYIGDTFYSVLGQDASPIMGYSVLNNQLVAHKQGEENGRNVFVRRGVLDAEGFASFEITNILQGEGTVATGSVATAGGEPVFLTKRGIHAMTPGDITGERYVQRRSYYIDGGLLREAGLEGARATVFGRFYVLAINGKLYLLDTEQKSYEKNEPYSTHQYEGYLWTNVPACCLATQGRVLWFGTRDGRLCRFMPGKLTHDYSDDGAPVVCWWTTPLMNLDVWGRLKRVTGVWVVGQPNTRSSGKIYYATDREYDRLVREYTMDVFSLDDIDFERFTFNTLDRPMVVATGKKAKKVKLFQVRVENDANNEPFGIIAMQIDYTVGGRIRR